MAEEVPAGPLNGRRILIYELGIGRRRREVLEKGVVRLGGQLVAKDDSPGPSDVVADDDSDPAALARLFPQQRLLKASWLSAALKTNALPDTEPFLFAPPSPPRPPTCPATAEQESEGEKKNDASGAATSSEPVGSQKRRHSSSEDSEADVEGWFGGLGAEGQATDAARLSPAKKALFVCAQDSGSRACAATACPNQLIVDKLGVLAKACIVSRDRWRALAYEKAATAIRRFPRKIVAPQDVAKIPGVGEKIRLKVVEILDTGQLRKADAVEGDERMRALGELEEIWGVGPVLAQQWYAAGIRCLDDVRAKAKLSRQQAIGLRHVEDFRERMPRAEAAEIVAVVEAAVGAAAEALGKGPAHCQACGSFRRGRADCGDVDVLLSHPHTELLPALLAGTLEQLRARAFLTDDLVEAGEEGGGRKYMGVCRLGEGRRHRRLDLICVPWEEKATASLYFTGSAHFTRSLYALAKRLGMRLNQHGLFAGVMRAHGQRLNAGHRLHTATERDVFARLGIPFREPHQRDHP